MGAGDHPLSKGSGQVSQRSPRWGSRSSRIQGPGYTALPGRGPAWSSGSLTSCLLLFQDVNAPFSLQQASFHPDVSEDVRARALRYGTECTLSYLDLLEHVLVVSGGVGRAGEELTGADHPFLEQTPPRALFRLCVLGHGCTEVQVQAGEGAGSPEGPGSPGTPKRQN